MVMNLEFQEYVFGAPYWGWLRWGIAMTLVVTLLTTVVSLGLGTAVSACLNASSRLIRMAGVVYVNLFRNTPPVPLLLFLVFALPGAFLSLTGFFFPRGMEFLLLVAGLSLNTSAYIAEDIRAGIRGVPEGQWAAAQVLGLGPVLTRLRIIYPQAVRIALPALGNRLIHNMKNSTVALVLPLDVDSMEVVGQAGRVAGQTFAWTEPLLFAAAVYLCLALVFSAVVNFLARRAQDKIEVTR